MKEDTSNPTQEKAPVQVIENGNKKFQKLDNQLLSFSSNISDEPKENLENEKIIENSQSSNEEANSNKISNKTEEDKEEIENMKSNTPESNLNNPFDFVGVTTNLQNNNFDINECKAERTKEEDQLQIKEMKYLIKDMSFYMKI